MADAAEHFDVIIIGGGLSGVGAACRLAELCPEKRFVVLEGREDLGGTWDLWRYPGVRSDSDMYTLAYPFAPWKSPVALADGDEIKKYIGTVAKRHGILPKMRFGCQVQAAAYDSAAARWSLRASRGSFTCNFLFMCSGYYQYDDGYVPDYPKVETFLGRVVHPMRWPKDLETAGKRVIVIGSGATAMSLVPKLAETAAHVTLLQRSPTYLSAMPRLEGPLHRALHAVLPTLASTSARLRHLAFAMASFKAAQVFPEKVKDILIRDVMKAMPGQDAKHFTPRYKPWDQRICAIADGDLFKAVNKGKVTFVTDHIEEFRPTGIALKSGSTLEADLVVSSTGFNLQANFPMNTMEVTVDGKPYVAADNVVYRGTMLSKVPNLAFSMGYVNASWTLRSDLSARFVCRLLKHMDKHGLREVQPQLPKKPLEGLTHGMPLNSNYVERARNSMPLSSDTSPWDNSLYHVVNKRQIEGASLTDGSLSFRGAGAPPSRL